MSRPPAGAPPAASAAPAAAPSAAPSGDPVRALMAEHRELCEQAVDPLDIAAGLEDAGICATTAGRYRHTDVFALAEELYARVERRPARPAPPRATEPWPGQALRSLGTALLHLPAVAVLAALPWLAEVAGRPGTVPALLLAAGWAALAVRGGPVGVRLVHGLGTALLLAPGAAAGTALAAAVALGTGSADFAARRLREAGHAHLGTAGTGAEFRGRMRPLLPLAAAAQLGAVAALTLALRPLAEDSAGAAQWALQAVLAVLFLLAAVVRHGGRPGLAAGALAACGAAVGTLHLLLPEGGPAALMPLAAAAAGAAVLAPCAWAVLGRPQAYRAAPRG
ncbi:hypothetical protein [Kitasatospora sp. NPDC059571]|uniref:hypothetical protein n=1 Tax=Kitasatospora sp. NPDC059571 TaxID=3346871 RepID=UPI0036758CC4